MVEPLRQEGVKRVFARVAPRAVTAVVAEGDGLGQRHVEPAGPGDAACHLGDLERVGQPRALMVLGEHEDLGLAGQSPEGGGVQDPVAVALETGAPRIGILVAQAVTRTARPRGSAHQAGGLGLFAFDAGERDEHRAGRRPCRLADSRRAVGVGDPQRLRRRRACCVVHPVAGVGVGVGALDESAHGGRPPAAALVRRCRFGVLHGTQFAAGL